MIFRVPGPCTILWGGNDVGVTKAGVVIRSTPNWVPITDDEHGAEPADYIWAGKILTVECLGMHEDLITIADPFVNVLGSGKVVGEHIGVDTTHYALQITERDGSSIWIAAHSEPVPAAMLLAATQELRVPLTFMILLDSSGYLFNTIPSYLPGV